ncbi:MAG: hypothetical protein QMC89_05700 [Candidatus Hodarchaeaceae archaeon]|nr:hypothetical protein [Candidatus Hodarchaeaceae archaeon]
MRKWSDSKFFGFASGHYQENQHRVLSLLEKDSDARVLDIGCTSGEFTLKVGGDRDEEVVWHGHR